MTRGEIWMFNDGGNTDRPVLVLTRGDMIPVLETVTVAPITPVVREVPSEVVLGANLGLGRPCAVNLHHVSTVARARLSRLIGTLPPPIMDKVKIALLFALEWDE